MSAERYELRADHTDWLDVRDPQGYRNTINQPGAIALIRQQARDIEQLRAECDLLTHKVICCGVAAWHSDPLLTTTGAYAGKWNSPQADCVRKLRAERDQLRAELAAAVAERDEARMLYAKIADDRDVAEARLAAIDAQPTLAIWGGWIDVSESNVPPDETELIARPAKD